MLVPIVYTMPDGGSLTTVGAVPFFTFKRSARKRVARTTTWLTCDSHVSDLLCEDKKKSKQ